MTDMSRDEFRRAGYEVVDWIASYLDHVRDLPVLPRVSPGFLSEQVPPVGPNHGEPIEDILEDFREQIVPGLNHWSHPRFHGYFAASASGPGILAEFLSAAVNINGMVWKSCPSAVELEQITLGWLRDWVGLPSNFFGVIYDTASTSSMHALVAAREMIDPEARTRGAQPNLIVYTSEQSHSSIEKGAIAVGYGQNNVRKIPVDAEFRMRPDALEQAIQADLAEGKRPCIVVATVGTTSTTSIDPVPAIADIADKYGLWLHVDSALAGIAAVAPEFRHVLTGAERAHSIVMNPHKWLFVPVDLSAFFTSRPDILRRAFSLVPEYLKTAEDTHAVNLMDYGVPLGRRFRALKLWFVMRYFGRHGIAAIIRNHITWAHELAEWIKADERFELAAPVPLSLVCFRMRGTDEQNRKLLDVVNAGGTAFLSHTVLNGRFAIRVSIGNVRTTREDVAATWRAIQEAAVSVERLHPVSA